jgi:hypothetical protein
MKSIEIDYRNDIQDGAIKHKFELAGLGRAPFKFVNVYEKRYSPAPGAPSQPAGTCQYCGNGIAWCCVIRDVDGKEFIVGNECVKKTNDHGLVKVITDAVKLAQRKVQREKAEAKRRAQDEVAIARIEAAQELLKDATVAARLSAQPHPFDHFAREGKTMLDYVMWMFTHSNIGGGLRAANIVEQAAKETNDEAIQTPDRTNTRVGDKDL